MGSEKELVAQVGALPILGNIVSSASRTRWQQPLAPG